MVAVDDIFGMGELVHAIVARREKTKVLTVRNLQNRSYHDLESYISASQSRGLLVAVPHGSDEPVGHCAATIYDNSTGWVSLLGIKSRFPRSDTC